MISGGNQTDGNSLERFLTPYQNSRLPLKYSCRLQLQIVAVYTCICMMLSFVSSGTIHVQVRVHEYIVEI